MKLDDNTLIQFALGSLDAETSKSVEKELAVSSELRKQLQEIQDTFVTIALAEHPLQPSDKLREEILGAIEKDSRFVGFVERFAEFFDLEKKTAQNLLAKIDTVAEQPWKSTLIPGVRILKFPGGPQVAEATCGIVSVEPDRLFPSHQHRGDEWVLVLQGTAREENDRTLQAGDILHAEPGSTHTFLTYGEKPFVFAVILHKANKWLIGRTIFDYFFRKKRISAGISDDEKKT